MIYGLNFGGPNVSAAPLRFARLKQFDGDARPRPWYYLAGVTDSRAEWEAMLITATNGRRRIQTVSRRGANNVIWYAIYTT